MVIFWLLFDDAFFHIFINIISFKTRFVVGILTFQKWFDIDIDTLDFYIDVDCVIFWFGNHFGYFSNS
jgi:hypothetical protein